MNANITPLHRGFVRQVPNAHIARALDDPDDILREAVKADNLRDLEGELAWAELQRFNREHPRLDGPPRQYRIGDESRALDLFAGIAFWFLVGIAPALCVLAIMVAK